MITCERCGKEIPDNIAICPSCGTITSTARSAKQMNQPPTSYGQYPPGAVNNAPPVGSYGQGYGPQPYQDMPPMQQSYMPPQQQNYGYGPGPQANAMYPPGILNVNITSNAPPMYATPITLSNKKTAALIVEILLNLFLSTYGVGWLMAGEITVGIVLLVCTPIYWIVGFLFILFTLGLGACIVVPLAIGAIILNAVLLNKTLDRKATQYVMVQPS